MMRVSSRADTIPGSLRSTPQLSKLALGFTLTTLLILIAAIGASAQHGAGAAALRRGPASVLLSVLVTLAGLAGAGSLALVFWGLAKRHRKSVEGSARGGRSLILVIGVVLAVFACLAGLLVLAVRHRDFQVVAALHGRTVTHGGPAATYLPFNQAASFASSGVIVCVVLVLVLLRLARSMSWRRALRRLEPLDSGSESECVAGPGSEAKDFGLQLTGLNMPESNTEPDPRRAVVSCYLKLLEIAARNGAGRQEAETPTEYLLRALTGNDAAVAPGTSLTGLFERACYSQLPVSESMRSDAISALRALQRAYLVGAVN